jgi:hypothetical protein
LGIIAIQHEVYAYAGECHGEGYRRGSKQLEEHDSPFHFATILLLEVELYVSP